MGAWGIGIFENDEASDWVYTLAEEEGADALRETLMAAADLFGLEEILEEPAGSGALAAAEVVAALLGNPSANLPEEVSEWVQGKELGSELASVAQKAVEVVLTNSELKELWQETEDFNEWKAIVNNLKERLA